MNVRLKVLLLLGLVVLIFAGGLVWLKQMDAREFQGVADRRLTERRESLNRFLHQWGESLKTFVNNHSSWDGMVEAVRTGDREWIEQNLGDNLLSSYETHAFWIYDNERKLLYSRNQLYSDGLHEAPLPRSGFDEALGPDRQAHFFAESPAGLLEVRGATIHPSADGSRSTEPRGYLFAARVWNREQLNEMELFTGNQLRLIDPKYDEPKVDGDGGAIGFSELLRGWDGAPVQRLLVQHESPVVAHFEDLSQRLLIWLGLFALSILAILALALRLWVWKPLEVFSRSLRTENLALLRPLERDHSEVGELARLISAFFLQRESLLEESRERRVAEKALAESSEQLRHAQKMEAIGRLAGGVAHDFNNILTVIIGYAGLLRDRLKHDKTGLQCSDIILHAGEQAAVLTRRLLAFSRKQILHPKVIDLNHLVEQTEKMLCRVIGEQIELRCRLEARQGRVRADPTQIEQVLMNLAVNARDAMARGGVLTITTGDTVVPESTETEEEAPLKPGRYVTLEVKDTGCGMDEATKARVFEPFFTTKDPGHGTGLGLATVYGIVNQSGGAVSVTSEVGEGTTFLIHLPMEMAAVDETEPASTTPLAASRGETILVVEDEKAVRELICTVLEDRGYDVLCADNGMAALTLAAEHRGPIDLLLSDVVMPRKTGPEMAQELCRRWPNLRVLFVSGYTDQQVATEGPWIKGAEIVEKPFTPEELAGHVRRLLDSDGPCGEDSPEQLQVETAGS